MPPTDLMPREAPLGERCPSDASDTLAPHLPTRQDQSGRWRRPFQYEQEPQIGTIRACKGVAGKRQRFDDDWPSGSRPRPPRSSIEKDGERSVGDRNRDAQRILS